MDICFDFEQGPEFLKRMQQYFKGNPKRTVNPVVDIRCSKEERFLLSGAYKKRAFWADFLCIRYGSKKNSQYHQEIHDFFKDLGFKRHWGKHSCMTPQEIKNIYEFCLILFESWNGKFSDRVFKDILSHLRYDFIDEGDSLPTLFLLNRHLDEHASDQDSPAQLFTNFFAEVKDQSKKLFKLNKFSDGIADVIVGQELFELNANDLSFIPSGLNDQEFDVFINLSPSSKTSFITDMIKKSHFTNDSLNCFIEGCDKPLGLINGRQNCNKCGNETCNTHSRYQMKLSVDARHDSVNGVWCRVCEKCFKSRKCYQITTGVSRNKSLTFLNARKHHVTKTQLEVNKITKRLEKLSKNVKDFQSSPLFSQKSLDTIVKKKPIEQNGVRGCTNCSFLLSLREMASQTTKPEIVTLYDSYKRYRTSLSSHLDTFHGFLYQLHSKKVDMNDQDYQQALKLRKELLDIFSQVEQISKRIKALPTANAQTRKLQDNVHMAIIQYLQTHMFSLQQLPSTSSSPQDPAIEYLDTEIIVVQDSIVQLKRQLQDAISRRKFEDAESIRVHLSELEEQLEVLMESK
ncbi:carboxypeptidase Y-deficient [Terramyces sp. JEL0728]|nr:carboxypeptidase Y-deficient [Terramyces sp. JEL0728]